MRNPPGRTSGAFPRIGRQRPGSASIRIVEETLFHTARLMEDKEFDSVEEANAFLHDLVSSGKPLPRVEYTTPAARAQAIVYEAAGSPPRKKTELARRAIEVWQDCADAYVMLAEAEKDPGAKRRLLEQGLAAGERALGLTPDKPRGEDVSFWSLEARPYMRARLALANHLYSMGFKEEAIAHYRALLDLNPDDNQGVRYRLLAVLLECGHYEDARRLVSKYDEETADWQYAKAFLKWSEDGDGWASRTRLRRAFQCNFFIPGYLLGREKIPRKLPEYMGIGDETEAVVYAADSAAHWRKTPGALDWISVVWEEFRGGLPFLPAAGGPSEIRSMHSIWRRFVDGKTLSSDDSLVARVMAQHGEFAVVWEIGPSVLTEEFEVNGVSPYAHVAGDVAIEAILKDETGPLGSAAAGVLRALTSAGIGRHEAIHMLKEVMLLETGKALAQCAPINRDSLAAKWRYVEATVNRSSSASPLTDRPERNEACPCGSGDKFKRCCGKDDYWPPKELLALARAISAGRGRAKSLEGANLVLLLGEGKYARADELKRLAQDHPLVHMENVAAVAEELDRRGQMFFCVKALEHNVEFALGLGDEELVRKATSAVAVARRRHLANQR